jgi:hypothetical protein
MSKINTCKNCQFCDKLPHYAYCHRYPPESAKTTSGTFNVWPRVFPDDWCGEFRMVGTWAEDMHRQEILVQEHRSLKKKLAEITGVTL